MRYCGCFTGWRRQEKMWGFNQLAEIKKSCLIRIQKWGIFFFKGGGSHTWKKNGPKTISFKLMSTVIVKKSYISIMDAGDATFTTSMDVVKVGLENKVSLELGVILGWIT